MKRKLIFLALSLASFPAFAKDGRAIVDFFSNPYQWGFLVALLFLSLSLHVVNKALNTIREITAPKPEVEPSAIVAEVADKEKPRTFMQILTNAQPIEKEADILLDHNYDGIHELDNSLPPWWLYGFYMSIVFAFVYMIRFHVMDGPSSAEEFQTAMAEGQAEVDAYLASASDLVDENSVVLLSNAGRIASGKKIYQANCVACHLADGGGLVGPNLTDEYWVHGGGIKEIFSTIKYGVAAKGMIAWKEQLSAAAMQEVASYILTLQGTTPAVPKDPEGEIWKDPINEADTLEAIEPIDSSAVTEPRTAAIQE